MKLIVNADDFGLSKGTNYGIIDAHLSGIVTSTTLMVTMPEVEHALELLKIAPMLKLGLHLNITFGKPMTNCPTLLKADGTFYKVKEINSDTTFDVEEIYQEFKAQYNKFVELVKEKPTHLDSHLYAHQKYAKAKEAIIRLANEMDVPVRDVAIHGYKKVTFFDWFKHSEHQSLIEILESKLNSLEKFEIAELMVHPAYLDPFLQEYSSYNTPRVEELKVLTSAQSKQLIKKHNIQLINYSDSAVRS